MRAEKTNTRIRKEQIAEAALELIGAEGFQALNMAAIGKRVGIVPSAVYRHFKSKDEVLDVVLEMLGARLKQNVEAAGRTRGGVLVHLKSILMRHARMLDGIQAIPYVVFSDSLYEGHPERKKKVHRIISDYLEKIEEILVIGQRQGVIRKDVSPRTLSLLFLGSILPAAVLSNLSEGRFDVAGHAAAAWPAFKRAVSTGEQTHSAKRDESR